MSKRSGVEVKNERVEVKNERVECSYMDNI